MSTADPFLNVKRDLEDARRTKPKHPTGWEPGVDTAAGTVTGQGGSKDDEKRRRQEQQPGQAAHRAGDVERGRKVVPFEHGRLIRDLVDPEAARPIGRVAPTATSACFSPGRHLFTCTSVTILYFSRTACSAAWAHSLGGFRRLRHIGHGN